ncbi:hypothetical protein KUL49_40240 [Alteromonas sp. KUL49]|nr:hypothetical protein KUL49_40240 [Alteromonas sp. KUL49]
MGELSVELIDGVAMAQGAQQIMPINLSKRTTKLETTLMTVDQTVLDVSN